MNKDEIIQNLELLKASIEWEQPINFCVDIDNAINLINQQSAEITRLKTEYAILQSEMIKAGKLMQSYADMPKEEQNGFNDQEFNDYNIALNG